MRAVHILHLTHSYNISRYTDQEIYYKTPGFSGYVDFIRHLKKNTYDIVHMHSVEKETFGIYALIARLYRVRVVITMHNPTVFSYGYILKRLCARFLISHTVCTSRYDVCMIDTYHIARKSRRSIVYQGFAEQYKEDMFSKESARSYLYRKMGISFTKNIRIVGTIVADDDTNGIEHLIDAAYLADTYKNLTNTIFVILVRETISESVRTQIDEMKVDGICFVIEHVENPEEYIRAFDIYMSPRIDVGDLYVLITALYMHISCIATKVGDTGELDAYVGAPLVPVRSAKYLTEALMYVIARSKEIVTKIGARPVMLPKKFTEEAERTAINNIYEQILKK